MGIIELASGASCWRGLDCFRKGKVLSCNPADTGAFDGRVQGSADEPYEVHIDTAHVRRSKCNCPHADGKRVICKHQVALYFAVIPGSAEAFEEEQRRLEEQYWDDLERERENRRQEIVKYVNSLTKQQLREKLINALVVAEDDAYYQRW